MATYEELHGLHNNSMQRNKVIVACVVAAETIMAESDVTPNHANRLLWAASVFTSLEAEANRMFWAVIAANADATLAQIEGATDSTIQTNIDEHVDLFATG